MQPELPSEGGSNVFLNLGEDTNLFGIISGRSSGQHLFDHYRSRNEAQVLKSVDVYRLEFPVLINETLDSLMTAEDFQVNTGISAIWEHFTVNSHLISEWMMANKTWIPTGLPANLAQSPLRYMINGDSKALVSFYTKPEDIGCDLPEGFFNYLIENTNVQICIYSLSECIISNDGTVAMCPADPQYIKDKIVVSFDELQDMF